MYKKGINGRFILFGIRCSRMVTVPALLQLYITGSIPVFIMENQPTDMYAAVFGSAYPLLRGHCLKHECLNKASKEPCRARCRTCGENSYHLELCVL